MHVSKRYTTLDQLNATVVSTLGHKINHNLRITLQYRFISNDEFV